MRNPFARNATRRGFLAGLAGTGASVAAGCAQGGPSASSATSGASSGTTSASATPTKLAIIHTNDSHGHDLLDDESLGLAAVSQLRKDYQERGYEVLLFDAGDFIQGEVVVNYATGEAGVDFYNLCGYDAVAAGNHEFDYGQDVLMQLAERAEFPILSANTIVDATGEPLLPPNTTFTLGDGRRVGVFGLTTPATRTTTSPLHVQGITFRGDDELYATAQAQADELRADGCELVVCLAHLGEDDACAPNRCIDVAEHVSGVDVYIDGHEHKEEDQAVKDASGADVPIYQADCYTHLIGVVTWEDGKLGHSFERFGSYDGQDAAIAKSVQATFDEVDEALGELLGETSFVLDGERDPGVRTRETNLGDFVADGIYWEAERMADTPPDAAILNGGGIRKTLAVGDIKLKDMVDVLPFINYAYVVQVTGAQLLEALEASTATTPAAMGGFPQVSRIEYTIDTTQPFTSDGTYPDSTFEKPAAPGTRVTITKVGDRDFSPTDTYVIATSDFMCAGGDTYYAFAQAAQESKQPIGYLISDCVRYYLVEECGGVVPDTYREPQGRITIIE